jgi:hypothetical protein
VGIFLLGFFGFFLDGKNEVLGHLSSSARNSSPIELLSTVNHQHFSASSTYSSKSRENRSQIAADISEECLVAFAALNKLSWDQCGSGYSFIVSIQV